MGVVRAVVGQPHWGQGKAPVFDSWGVTQLETSLFLSSVNDLLLAEAANFRLISLNRSGGSDCHFLLTL